MTYTCTLGSEHARAHALVHVRVHAYLLVHVGPIAHVVQTAIKYFRQNHEARACRESESTAPTVQGSGSAPLTMQGFGGRGFVIITLWIHAVCFPGAEAVRELKRQITDCIHIYGDELYLNPWPSIE